MIDFYDFGLWLYEQAEKQSCEAWNAENQAYKYRCYGRAERLQAVANILGFKDIHWQEFKIWRDSE